MGFTERLPTKHQDYPIDFWSILINEWSEDAKPRLQLTFLHRISRLPNSVIIELKYPISKWIERSFEHLLHKNKDAVLLAFDKLISALNSGETVNPQGIINNPLPSNDIHESHHTYFHVSNGPIANFITALINYLYSLKLERNEKIPSKIKLRLKEQIDSPGKSADQAISVLTFNMSLLFHIDPIWVIENIIPHLDFADSSAEFAWSGYLSSQILPRDELWPLLKPLFVNLFPNIYKWKSHDAISKIATQRIIYLSSIMNNVSKGLSEKEVRHCLRNMNDNNRQDAIFALQTIGSKGDNEWNECVIPFINGIWPKEKSYRTSTLLPYWMSLLEKTGEAFPHVLESVRKFLVPMDNHSIRLSDFTDRKNMRLCLTKAYPRDVLILLDAVIPINCNNIPFFLNDVLNLMIESEARITLDRRYLRLMDIIEEN